jgi:hypothetical protein
MRSASGPKSACPEEGSREVGEVPVKSTPDECFDAREPLDFISEAQREKGERKKSHPNRVFLLDYFIYS